MTPRHAIGKTNFTTSGHAVPLDSSNTLRTIERHIPRRGKPTFDPRPHDLCAKGKSTCTANGRSLAVEFYNTLKKTERSIHSRDTLYDCPPHTLCVRGKHTSINHRHPISAHLTSFLTVAPESVEWSGESVDRSGESADWGGDWSRGSAN